MKKLFLFIALMLFAPHLHAQSQCPTPGGTGTTDGGLVSYSCGPANGISGTCQATALGKYASSPLTNLQGEIQPCMDVYYNTADGATNHNPTIILSGTSGNIGMGTSGAIDWSVGLAQTDGQNIVYSLVDGSAFAGTPSAGKHYNVVTVYGTLMAWAQINGAMSAGATSTQIYIGGLLDGGSHNDFWPNATGYNMYIGGDLVGPITSQTGTWGSSGTGILTVSWATGVANAHPSGENAFAVGTDGSGAPSATCMGQLAMSCDIGRAMTYLTANSYPAAGSPTVPGNGHFFYFGVSGGATTGVKLISTWKALALALNSGANVSGTLDGMFGVSPDPDYGNSAVIQSVGSPDQVSPCSSIATWNQPVASGPWPQTGPGIYTATPAGVASVTTISVGATKSINGLPVTGANAAFLYDRGFSGQGIAANMGYVPVNSDHYLGRTYLEIGQTDNQNPCSAQYNFGATIPGASYRILSGYGHGADLTTQTGSCTVSGATCYNSQTIKDFISLVANMYVYGSRQASGMNASGVY